MIPLGEQQRLPNSILGFLKSAQAGDYSIAAQYLDGARRTGQLEGGDRGEA